LLAIGTTGSLATTATGATARTWPATPCSPPRIGSSAARSAPIGVADVGQQAWYRLDPHLDRAGALDGQRLSFGLDRERDARVLDLPSESFAAGPFGQTILIGADDRAVSRLFLLDVPNDCLYEIAEEEDVIRRATVDPNGERIVEMRVDRVSREDLGVWVRRLDHPEEAVQVLPAIPADERFGRTFSTEFTWALDGTTLAVQSCGEVACRTRLLGADHASLGTIDDPDVGTLIGLDGTTVVAYAACRGLPCPVLAFDLASADRSVVTEGAIAAVLVRTPVGARLVHEVVDGPGLALRSAALDQTSSELLGGLESNLRLVPPPGLAGTATTLPEGWVALAPEGRLPAVDPPGLVHLRPGSGGQAIQLGEIVR
jgi:hypothetical protein